MFFYKKRKRTERMECSFEKNRCPTLILNQLDTIQSSHILKSVIDTVHQNFIKSTNATNIFHYNRTIQSKPTVYFDMHPNAKFLPKLCPESNGFDLPLQETHTFQPYELKKNKFKNQISISSQILHCSNVQIISTDQVQHADSIRSHKHQIF